jgi:FKBP-type peptidyl-prolyl cis-trans isomerase FklB
MRTRHSLALCTTLAAFSTGWNSLIAQDTTPAQEIAVVAATTDNQLLMEKVSYFLGADAIKRFKANNIAIQPQSYLQGVQDAFTDEQPKYTPEELQQALMTFQTQLREQAAQQAQVQASNNVKAGTTFLEENAKRETVTTTASGLQYEILTEGSGPKPSAEKSVTVHYTGTLIDGTVFDSSVQRGQPATFGVGQVIPGWTEALQLMPEGSKWKLFIPSNLAYGERGAGADIGPNETLIFEVELLKVN